MKLCLKRLIIVAGLALLALSALASKINLLIDAKNVFAPPQKFRTTETIPNLHLMGSAQFSEANLRYILASVHKPSCIVDLRQESHGFVNEIPISWYAENNWANIGKTPAQINMIEHSLLNSLREKITIIAYQNKSGKNPITITPRVVMNEEQLAAKYNIRYIRLPVSDHSRPEDTQIDRFVALARDTMPQEWLYLHCRGGKGRTTSFMAMADMMQNAKRNSFEGILSRQHALGGKLLDKLASRQKYASLAEKRLAFLRTFYSYCKENHDDYRTSWSQWLREK